MDNDGDMDFVISGLYDKYIRWIENVDGGTAFYELSIGSWVGTGPKSLVVSDINNDGSMDIISNMAFSNLLIHKNSSKQIPLLQRN
ncbi:MAG: VCBS repeat-containing protein [Bacteroidetes bacterium]|nr:VCBS repeat-containing protein [Bacteroidota bacterium]